MRYSLNVITPPINYPIEPDEAKTWLRVDPSNVSEAVLIEEIIATATKLVEYYTARAILTQTLELQLIPELKSTLTAGIVTSGYETLPSVIKLYRPPLQTVTSIKAVELSGAEHTISASNYYYDTSSVVGRIMLKDGASWDYYDEGSYKIRYVAGYGSTIDTVPPQLRHAVKLMASQMYATRERGDLTLTPEMEMTLDELRITHYDLE